MLYASRRTLRADLSTVRGASAVKAVPSSAITVGFSAFRAFGARAV
jgi:hypothetical protein